MTGTFWLSLNSLIAAAPNLGFCELSDPPKHDNAKRDHCNPVSPWLYPVLTPVNKGSKDTSLPNSKTSIEDLQISENPLHVLMSSVTFTIKHLCYISV